MPLPRGRCSKNGPTGSFILIDEATVGAGMINGYPLFSGGASTVYPMTSREPKAFDTPLHVGRPNVGDEELFLNLLSSAFERRWFTNDGPLVRELEQRIAGLLGVEHVVTTANATLGLEIAARALGLSGQVILPAFTFVATAHAMTWIGLEPVFADIDPTTHNIDPSSVEALITPKTSAILGVHLWGRPADVDALSDVARRHGLRLLFDAAHAFGSGTDAGMVGTFGDAEVFSFHATKYFNTFEGGAITTNDGSVAERARLLRNFGFAGADKVVSLGTNAKMAEPNAAMGLAGLPGLASVQAANRAHYDRYLGRLSALPGLAISNFLGQAKHNFQYVVVEVGPECRTTRDELLDYLQSRNVLARRYFWPGVHRMEPYASDARYAQVTLPETEAVASRVLVLPTGPSLDASQVDRICDLITWRCSQ